MAEASDIAALRLYADVPDNVAPFTDEVLSGLIDDLGVAGATAETLRRLLPQIDKLVDTTEAGASHKFSTLGVNARKRLEYWESRASTGPEVANGSRVRVKKIQRS